jgi:hypothetical protein
MEKDKNPGTVEPQQNLSPFTQVNEQPATPGSPESTEREELHEEESTAEQQHKEALTERD